MKLTGKEFTMELLIKPEPSIVTFVAGLPRRIVSGVMEVIEGTGLGSCIRVSWPVVSSTKAPMFMYGFTATPVNLLLLKVYSFAIVSVFKSTKRTFLSESRITNARLSRELIATSRGNQIGRA